MYEVACEGPATCDTDNYSFKAYLARWMVASTKYAPFIHDTVMTKISASASAAALQCSGGSNKQMCGQKWTNGANWDNTQGVGQQMGALAVIQANLIDEVFTPVTNRTGGTSQGNVNAGGSSRGGSSTPSYLTDAIGSKDKAGAGILTTLVLIAVIGGAWWMVA